MLQNIGNILYIVNNNNNINKLSHFMSMCHNYIQTDALSFPESIWYKEIKKKINFVVAIWDIYKKKKIYNKRKQKQDEGGNKNEENKTEAMSNIKAFKPCRQMAWMSLQAKW